MPDVPLPDADFSMSRVGAHQLSHKRRKLATTIADDGSALSGYEGFSDGDVDFGRLTVTISSP